jgi:hypothetical protein
VAAGDVGAGNVGTGGVAAGAGGVVALAIALGPGVDGAGGVPTGEALPVTAGAVVVATGATAVAAGVSVVTAGGAVVTTGAGAAPDVLAGAEGVPVAGTTGAGSAETGRIAGCWLDAGACDWVPGPKGVGEFTVEVPAAGELADASASVWLAGAFAAGIATGEASLAPAGALLADALGVASGAGALAAAAVAAGAEAGTIGVAGGMSTAGLAGAPAGVACVRSMTMLGVVATEELCAGARVCGARSTSIEGVAEKIRRSSPR